MKIAVTHKSPDFDALASAYAAMKLYDCDFVATCSSYEANVDDFIKDKIIEFPLVRMNEKDIAEVNEIELLVITDCKLEKRLGKLSALINKAKKIIIYDHHTTYARDIETEYADVIDIGSITTLLVERLIEKDISITPDEASFFILAVYEDTGMLTFKSTTTRDMDAAKTLLQKGADLSLINDYVKREMNKEQVFLLNELLMNMQIVRVSGAPVAYSHASIDLYVGEVSYLAHKLMDMENLDSLFIVVRAGETIVVVGRSKVDVVNASSILYHFGGGGHPTAASATIKDTTLHETLEKLKALIYEEVHPVRKAFDIMTSPVKSVGFKQTFNEAKDKFMIYNLNMMPVVEDGVPVGLVSRKDILDGIKHGLDKEPVSNIMQVEFESVTPETSYYELEEAMISNNQKMITVIDSEGKLSGVVTRTDMLRLMHEEVSKMPRYMQGRLSKMGMAKSRNIRNIMEDRLPKAILSVLKDVGEMGDKTGLHCYMVGGIVRDLLMKIDNDDVDIVVEGDAAEFAKKFAHAHDARVSVHLKFKTAVVTLPDGFKLDFATSRTEYYSMPASAPIVENASIRNDLYRRDFSINAMAVKLNGGEYGRLLDFFGGQRDIQDKKIRVLHSLSFVDDPSRVLRAVRFAVRFGFEIGPHTDRLLKHAVRLKLFERIIGQRLFLELKYILELKEPEKAFDILKKYDVLHFIHEKAIFDELKQQRFAYLNEVMGWFRFQMQTEPEIYKSRFFIFFYSLKFQDIVKLGKRLDLSAKQHEELIKGFLKTKNTIVALKRLKEPKPSELTEQLSELEEEFILAAGAVLGEKYEEYIKNYFTKYRHVKLDINGNSLIKAGLTPSKKFSLILNKVYVAKLDGEVNSFDEELDLALKLAGEKDIEQD